MNIGAVLTGDIIGSTSAESEFLPKLKIILEDVDKSLSIGKGRYEIYRGDSFQYVLDDPLLSFRAAVLIRAGLKSRSIYPKYPLHLDAKISIGIGSLGNIPHRPGEANDEAFILSGRLLDQIDKEKFNMAIGTAVNSLADIFDITVRWADDIVSNLTPVSAEALYLYWLKDMSQAEIGLKLGITQPGVYKRFQQAQIEHLNLCEQTFRKTVEELLK